MSLRCPLCINQSSSSATSGVVSWPWLWPGSTSWPPTCLASTPRRRTRRSWPSCSSSSGCFASFWPVGQAGFSAWLQLWTSDHSFPVLPDKHDYTCYDFLIIYHFFSYFDHKASILPTFSPGSCVHTLSGLHKLWYPGIRDMSTWGKIGAHGEHGDVFLFSNFNRCALICRELNQIFIVCLFKGSQKQSFFLQTL